MVDTRRKKVVAARIRVLPAHDIKDVNHLLKQCKPSILVADKAYDSEAIHKLCHDSAVRSLTPPRRNTRRGFYRRKQLRSGEHAHITEEKSQNQSSAASNANTAAPYATTKHEPSTQNS